MLALFSVLFRRLCGFGVRAFGCRHSWQITMCDPGYSFQANPTFTRNKSHHAETGTEDAVVVARAFIREVLDIPEDVNRAQLTSKPRHRDQEPFGGITACSMTEITGECEVDGHNTKHAPARARRQGLSVLELREKRQNIKLAEVPA